MGDLLRSAWREPAAPDPPGRTWRDWALVGVLAAVVLAEAALRPDLLHRTVWVVLELVLLPLLPWRRTHALPTLLIAFLVASAVTVVLGEQPELVSLAALLVLPYALARWGAGREILAGIAVMVVVAVIPWLVIPTAPGDIIGGSAVAVTALALGLATRFRARVRAREIDRAKMLERERLARDLHDTVAHHVSAIAVRAQAGLAVAGADPGAAADALRVIETEASRTLTEMRSIVRALRRDDRPDRIEWAPHPGLAEVRRLADRDGAGPAVEVTTTGDVDTLSEPVATTVYRLAQESVTNARRHARGATRIRVDVTVDNAAVTLVVSDDGAPVTVRPAPGYGIIGMAERADLLGGTCTAGPDPDGGWTVTARLPRRIP